MGQFNRPDSSPDREIFRSKIPGMCRRVRSRYPESPSVDVKCEAIVGLSSVRGIRWFVSPLSGGSARLKARLMCRLR